MGEISFIFHGLRSPENLGAIARAMNNFGWRRLVLAEPLTYAFGEAEKLAVKSVGLLDTMRVESSLEAALAPCTFTIGTSSRAVRGRPVLTGREAAARLHRERSRGDVALLFGSEKLGLNDRQLDLCQEVCRLPTVDPQPSLNVAQAAAIMAYELALASADDGAAPPPAADPSDARATREEMEGLYDKMAGVLLEADFLNPQNPEDILDELRRLVDRAGPSTREARLLLTAFRKIEARDQQMTSGQTAPILVGGLRVLWESVMARIVDISSMLGPASKLPADSTRPFVLRLARLVEYGATLPHNFYQETLIECAKHPQGVPCQGLVWVLKLGDDRIEVSCPVCHEVELIITRWRDTPWGDGTPEHQEIENP